MKNKKKNKIAAILFFLVYSEPISDRQSFIIKKNIGLYRKSGKNSCALRTEIISIVDICWHCKFPRQKIPLYPCAKINKHASPATFDTYLLARGHSNRTQTAAGQKRGRSAAKRALIKSRRDADMRAVSLTVSR